MRARGSGTHVGLVDYRISGHLEKISVAWNDKVSREQVVQESGSLRCVKAQSALAYLYLADCAVVASRRL